MKAAYFHLAIVVALAACVASEPSQNYWNNRAARSNFDVDNQSCSARASRMAPTGRPDLLSGGVTVPENRVDRPPQRWVSSVAQNAYMDCMRESGWEPSRR